MPAMPMWQMLLIVCPLVFLASLIDSIAGGGGLISLPAYMLTGLPMHTACGCNKLSALMGSISANITYFRKGKIHIRPALISGALSAIGAIVGVRVNLLIEAAALQRFFVVLLPFVALFVLFGAKKGKQRMAPTGWRLYLICAAIGLVMGLYDGLIGPGTGTLLIFLYTTFVGFDYVTASGTAKVPNLASNLASAILYFMNGKILLPLALSAGVCSVLGGMIGPRIAIRGGERFIRILLIVVLCGIFLKLLTGLF